MMNILAKRFFKHMVRCGRLTVIWPDTTKSDFQGKIGPHVTIKLTDQKLVWQILMNPSLGAGEGYMDGRLQIIDGDIYDFLAFCAQNAQRGKIKPTPVLRFLSALRRMGRFIKRNRPGRARQNVAHHYDLGNELYALFLDKNHQYSCAYFKDSQDNLHTAQQQKMQHLGTKLRLQADQKVLDIGSGWGGLARFLAGQHNVHVTGLTLSDEQIESSRSDLKQHGLESHVKILKKDYRHEHSHYDRIVSVGMFEHVGTHFYQNFFDKIYQLLDEDGIAVIHSIGRSYGPDYTDDWVEKYIFPGGYAPALSEVLPAVERSGLIVSDIEVLRLHYAETLRQWRKNFASNRDKAKALYDERFCRMWEFYLAGSEAAFRYEGLMVFQLQLIKNHQAAPTTRDYMYPALQREQTSQLEKIGQAA